MSQVYQVSGYVTNAFDRVYSPGDHIAVKGGLFADKAAADAYVAKLQAALDVLVGDRLTYKLVVEVRPLEVSHGG